MRIVLKSYCYYKFTANRSYIGKKTNENIRSHEYSHNFATMIRVSDLRIQTREVSNIDCRDPLRVSFVGNANLHVHRRWTPLSAEQNQLRSLAAGCRTDLRLLIVMAPRRSLIRIDLYIRSDSLLCK